MVSGRVSRIAGMRNNSKKHAQKREHKRVTFRGHLTIHLSKKEKRKKKENGDPYSVKCWS